MKLKHCLGRATEEQQEFDCSLSPPFLQAERRKRLRKVDADRFVHRKIGAVQRN
jgi:hypothetical protein